MRHEPKIMTPGNSRYLKGKVYRPLRCDECGIVGGESGAGCDAPPTRVCCGFDDDTGRPFSPLAPPSPEVDTPFILDVAARRCSCGFRAATIEELAEHYQQHKDEN